MRLKVLFCGSLVLVAGCGSNYKHVPAGPDALPLSAATDVMTPPLESYRIGALDELRVNVFREPDLSLDRVVVDASGYISLPLIGSLNAFGRTTNEIAEEVRTRLNERYLRDAQVSVAVINPVSYTFTVDGQVKKPGTYQIPGRVTLSQSIAIGEGVTDNAKLSEVLVIRTVNGQRYIARFNLVAIRGGRQDDLELKAGDQVLVGFDSAKQLYRDALAVIPTLGTLFVLISQNN